MKRTNPDRTEAKKRPRVEKSDASHAAPSAAISKTTGDMIDEPRGDARVYERSAESTRPHAANSSAASSHGHALVTGSDGSSNSDKTDAGAGPAAGDDPNANDTLNTAASSASIVFPEGMELKHGARIEVQWDVQQPENEDIGSVAIWWGATYIGRSAEGKTTGTVRPHAVHVLLYDARAGYPETESEVAFLSMSRLLDMGEEDTLMWRHEGREWVCDPNDQGAGPLLEEVSPGLVMTMPDLLKDQTRLEHNEHNGVSVQTLGMAALGRLPYLAQTNLASNFRSFADSIKERLAEIRRVRGAGATVTSDDIRAIMESIEGAAA